MYSTVLSGTIILATVVCNRLPTLAIMHEKFYLIMIWYEQDSRAYIIKCILFKPKSYHNNQKEFPVVMIRFDILQLEVELYYYISIILFITL